MRKLIRLGALITMIFAFNACTENEYVPQEDFAAPLTRTSVLQSEIAYCGTYEIIDFMAGQHYFAGNIIVGNDEEYLYVTFQTKDGWQIGATHLYVGEKAPDKAAPGQFPYKGNHSPAVTEYTYMIDLKTLPECMVIAAHAEVQRVVDGVIQSETAWGKGDQIKKGNWAMMFNYCKKECVPEEEEPTLCYQEETAWVYGPRFVTQGNWATYTPYAGNEQTIDIFAGQHILVGNAHFTAIEDNMVTLTLSLTDGWELNAGSTEMPNNETVKIQGYVTTPPANNPAPGQFNTYKGTNMLLMLPYFPYYGIHLDVRKAEPCPEIE